jgi:hypothetical protein
MAALRHGRWDPLGLRHRRRRRWTSDPDARLYRKGPGQAAKLAYMGHVMMENRHGLAVDTRLTLATGGDKAYDAAGFVAALRERNATPHVAQNTSNRRSAIDGRTTRHPGYAISGRRRKRIEEIFGWTKATAGLRKTRHRGWRASVGSSPSPPPPTTWCVCPSYWAWRHSMPVLCPNAEHAAKTPFESRSKTAISAIMACICATYSKIALGVLRFSASC